MPVDRTGLFSFMILSWMTRLMWKAYKKGLKSEDIPLCSKYDMCEYNTDRYVCVCQWWLYESESEGHVIFSASLYLSVITLHIRWAYSSVIQLHIMVIYYFPVNFQTGEIVDRGTAAEREGQGLAGVGPVEVLPNPPLPWGRPLLHCVTSVFLGASKFFLVHLSLFKMIMNLSWHFAAVITLVQILPHLHCASLARLYSCASYSCGCRQRSPSPQGCVGPWDSLFPSSYVWLSSVPIGASTFGMCEKDFSLSYAQNTYWEHRKMKWKYFT